MSLDTASIETKFFQFFIEELLKPIPMPSSDLNLNLDKEISLVEAAKDSNKIKMNMDIIPSNRGMIVYAIARIDSDKEKNKTLRPSCKKGKPISGYGCYDVSKDCLVLRGIDYLALGDFPFSYRIQLKDSKEFFMDIPVPEKVLKKYLTDTQKSSLEEFKTIYKKDCTIEFLQILKVSHE